jgi:hypothetical protein
MAQAQQSIPHVEWIDLHNDGIAQEIIVMSRNVNNGDVYFIAISDLDQIDRLRMLKVLKKRDADKYPLYDLLANETLKNGMNALEFFHQLVKVRTMNGRILPVDSGKRGAMNFTANPAAVKAQQAVHAAQQEPKKTKKADAE